GDGAENSLVAVRRLPNDFVYAVVHHSRRVRYCVRLRVACANLATRVVAPGCYRRNRRWIINLCLLRPGVLDYGYSAPLSANVHSVINDTPITSNAISQ